MKKKIYNAKTLSVFGVLLIATVGVSYANGKIELINPMSLTWSNGTYYIGDFGDRSILKFSSSAPGLSYVTRQNHLMGHMINEPINLSVYGPSTISVSDPVLCGVININTMDGKRTVLTDSGHLGLGDNCPMFMTNMTNNTIVASSHDVDGVISINADSGKGKIIAQNASMSFTYGITPISQNTYAITSAGKKHPGIYEASSVSGKIVPLVEDTCANIKLKLPYSVTKLKNKLYFDDVFKNALFSYDLSSHQCSLVSGLNKGQGPSFVKPMQIVATKDKIGIIDGGARALFEVDPVTGNRTELYKEQQPIKHFYLFGNLYTTADAIYVCDSRKDAIYRIDKKTRKVTLLTGDSKGNGMPFLYVHEVTQSGDSFYATDGTHDAIFKINPTTGDRTIISSDTYGTGFKFDDLGTLVPDDASHLYALDFAKGVIAKVNIVTGDRIIISGDNVGSGPELLDPYDSTKIMNNMLYITQLGTKTQSGSVVKIDLSNGNRTIITDATHGSGPKVVMPAGILYLGNNTLLISNYKTDSLYTVNISTGERKIYKVFNMFKGIVSFMKPYDSDHILITDTPIFGGNNKFYLLDLKTHGVVPYTPIF
jgi:hypothetical protein